MNRFERLCLRDMRAMITLAETRHFGRAAAALGISQPTLTAIAKKVEAALQIRMIERTQRRFLITAAGDATLAVFRRTVEAAQEAAGITRGAQREPLTGEFRLGVIPTVGPYLMPKLLLDLRRKAPKLDLTVQESVTAELVAALQQGRLDAAILSPTPGLPPLELIALYREPFRLIAPRGHSVLALPRLTLSSLAAPEMVLLEEGHCLRDQVLDVCNPRAGAGAKMLTTSLETLKYIVATGAGYSLMPSLAARADAALESLVEFRKFEGRIPGRLISLASRRGSAAAIHVAALAEFIRSKLPQEVQPVTPSGALGHAPST